MKNEMAMKREKFIREEMKKRQISGLKKGDELPFRQNGQNGEITSTRKELAKLAKTSEVFAIGGE